MYTSLFLCVAVVVCHIECSNSKSPRTLCNAYRKHTWQCSTAEMWSGWAHERNENEKKETNKSMCIYLKEKRAAYRQTTHQILNVQCSESWWRGESDVNGNRARDYWIMSHWNESLEHTATFLLALLPYPLCISHTHSISAGSFFLYVHSTFSHPVSCTHREREKTIPDVCWPYVYTWIFATFFSRCVSKMLFLGASFLADRLWYHICACRRVLDFFSSHFSFVRVAWLARRVCFSNRLPPSVHRPTACLSVYIKRAKSFFFSCTK